MVYTTFKLPVNDHMTKGLIMKLGIIGLPGSGKSTVFQALTHSAPEQWAQKGTVISTVQVPDDRVNKLSELISPKKTVWAHLEYLLPRVSTSFNQGKKQDDGPWSEIRPCDALVHIVRNFLLPEDDPLRPQQDWQKLEGELIFADLVVVEKRIERIDLDAKRGRKMNAQERSLLEQCLETLEGGNPLRDRHDLAKAPLLRGFALLSAKPVLTVFNNDDEDETLPAWTETRPPAVVVRGALEKEFSELSPDDRETFMEAYNVTGSARKRLIRHSCQVLGLITFFTVVNHEVRAWLIPQGTKAVDAAEVIHTDMKKGFIRAEILAYDDLVNAGTYQQAKKDALVRIEGKDYEVQDGEVIYFRFNV
jgi:GTP-binding protein YchF